MKKIPSLLAALILVAAFAQPADAAPQPLPQGMARYSVAIGRFQTSTAQNCWVRMINWEFNGSNGTVTATLHQWDSVNEYGKTTLNNHTCSVGGATPRTCTQYSPTGWMVGGSANPSFAWSGVYSYNTSTGALHIAWGTGAVTEDWTVSLPESGLAKLTYVSSSSNYGITHGVGYGSNAQWSVFKTLTGANAMPRLASTAARRAVCNWNGVASAYSVTNWTTNEAVDFSSYTSSSNGTTIHAKKPSSPSVCTAALGCYSPATGNTGIIYHLASNNLSRAMVYNHHCACLPSPGTYPCYSGNIHVYAMRQVINSAGNFRGLIGIEQQDQPGSAGFQYQLKDWLF